MGIQLTPVGMQGDKQADFDTEFFGPFEQGIGGAGEKLVEKRLIIGKNRPEFIGHGEGNMLPFTVGEDVLLLGNPLLRSLHATGTATFAFATLAEILRVRAGGGSTTITANAHGTRPASEHALDDEFNPFRVRNDRV